METYNVCELINKAAQQRGRRARVLRRRLQVPSFREEFENEITEALATDNRAVALVPAMGSVVFDKNTEFGVANGEVMQQLIDLIMEYLPGIMDFVLRYVLPLFF